MWSRVLDAGRVTSSPPSRRNAVFDRVLDERLQEHRRHWQDAGRAANVPDAQAVLKADSSRAR